ncbi:hypothetical protein BDCR2A_01927 [Borrelia duttonii CR2A]|uniref:Variable outer membrane protein n=1 Tax=Borrelia duttonii CR2A TaxID=1432657 RepID=W6TVV7_9SPIR|nr:hypothetical protein [Borrelia duttonii]ETZ17161.1 hypothetical protein BDCR2A_01927 [Borrelia duttonii CR2A]
MKEGKIEEEVREYERGEKMGRIVKGIIMGMMVVVMGCNSWEVEIQRRYF